MTAIIVYVSSLPSHSLPGDGSLSEQVLSNFAHIPAYAFLAFLWFRTFNQGATKNEFGFRIMIITGLVLFAISDEIHQSFVPGRFASISDLCLDVIGILLGFLAVNPITRMF